MYVCVCHAVTDRDLSGGAARCDGRVADCYRALGVRPTCGKCVPMVRDAVRAVGSAAALTYPAATA
jgi:bacterioferritin-associated ferredoxin